ncbi:hypothetical protein GCM10023188_25740 [Pontibacter saemangeumensis]|uniref:Uncharacterized protein n=1 Tax=Pontibacter saemangeumensis TaxID=1084525 RepID=A0ABP8LRU7_9BACT
MGLIQTRVIGPAEEGLRAQAEARGMSLYRYTQLLLTEAGRGNIRLVAVVTSENLLPERQCGECRK